MDDVDQDEPNSHLRQAKIKSFKYFEKDSNTSGAVCKLCGVLINDSRDTGLLRLHLEKVHKFHPIKLYDPSSIPKPPPAVPSPNLPKFVQRSKQIRPILPNPNSTAPRHSEWLNPFYELVSEPSSEQLDQDRDQYKYFIHCTQFTEPLKYFQYNRYMEEQLTQIRDQLNDLASLHKIPGMVTLDEREDKFSGRTKEKGTQTKYQFYTWQYKQTIGELVNETKKQVQFMEWKKMKILKKLNLIDATQNNQANNQVQEQKGQSQEEREQEKNNFQKDEGQKKRQGEEILGINSDSLEKAPEEAAKEFRQYIKKQTRLLLTEMDIQWSQNQEVVFEKMREYNYKIIRIRPNKKQNDPPRNSSTEANSQQKQAEQQEIFEGNSSFYLLTHKMMKKNYKKYGDSLTFLQVKVCNYTIFLAFIQNWRLIMEIVGIIIIQNEEQCSQQFMQSGILLFFNMISTFLPQSITIISQQGNQKFKKALDSTIKQLPSFKAVQLVKYKLKNDRESAQNESTKINGVYKKFITKLTQIYKKFSSTHGNIGLFQVQSTNLGISLNNKISEEPGYLDSKSFKGKNYQGFGIEGRDPQWRSLSNMIKSQIGQCVKPEVGKVLKIVLQKEKQIQFQAIEKQINQKRGLSFFQVYSPKLVSIMQEMQKFTEKISILKHISPTQIQLFTVLPHDDPIPQQYPEDQCITQSCCLFKNTVIYSEVENCWICNCNRIYKYGIPCFHLMKIVQKMGGNAQYYINSRWQATYNEYKQLEGEMRKKKIPIHYDEDMQVQAMMHNDEEILMECRKRYSEHEDGQGYWQASQYENEQNFSEYRRQIFESDSGQNGQKDSKFVS